MARLDLSIPYLPRKEQAPFHKSRARFRYLRGGVGAGKTIAGAADAIVLAVVNSGFDGMVIAPSFPLLKRVTLRTLLKLLPRKLIRDHKKVDRYVELCNGSRIYYGSSDRPESLEGSNLAWVWLDEARYTSKEAWEVIVARVRAPNAPRQSILLTSTPTRGWLYEVFESGREDTAQFVVPTASNHYLPPEYLASLQASYSAALFRQYVEGDWGSDENAVFPEFRLDRHVCEIATVEGHPVDVLFDPGYRRASVAFAQYFPRCPIHRTDGCLHVVGEWHPENTPTERIAPVVGALFERQRWRRGRVITDPAANAASVTVGYSDVDVWQSEGWQVDWPTSAAQRAIPNGIELMRSLLSPTTGNPRLWLSSTLREDPSRRGLIAALEGSTYPPPKGGKPISDVPVKDGLLDHSRDALRYGLVTLFPPVQSRIVIV